MTPAQAAMWASTLSLAKTTGTTMNGTAEELWEQLPEMIRESWKASAHAVLEAAALVVENEKTPRWAEVCDLREALAEMVRKLKVTQ